MPRSIAEFISGGKSRYLRVADLLLIGDGSAQERQGALALVLPGEGQAVVPAALRFATTIADSVEAY